MEFDNHEILSFPTGGFWENEISVGVDMSSSIHANNKEKDILML